MRAQLAAGIEDIAAIKAALQDELQTFRDETVAEMQTFTTWVWAVQEDVNDVSSSLTELSTAVTNLKEVARTGEFSDLTGRPSAVSAIETTMEEKSPGVLTSSIMGKNDCRTGTISQVIPLGSADGRFCALSQNRYTPRAQCGSRRHGTGLP